MPIHVEISPAELIDRLTALEVRASRSSDDEQAMLREELTELRAIGDREIPARPDIAMLRGQLKAVNETLWETEGGLREMEGQKDFGPRFVELARA
ncbi:MAG: hypothetical protein MO852_17365, partial [Candidatus Devosia euplotis]|nr:hypothetical protein [Candidatus Devosia euplotis]